MPSCLPRLLLLSDFDPLHLSLQFSCRNSYLCSCLTLCIEQLTAEPVIGASLVVDDRRVACHGGELRRLLTPEPGLARKYEGVLDVWFGKIELRFKGFCVHIKGTHLG